MHYTERAKEIVNKVYQPTGILNHTQSSAFMWEFSSKASVEIIDEILKVVETRHDREKLILLKEEILKNK